MTHFWYSTRYLPERRYQPCRILIARKGKYLLEFEDGYTVVTVRGTFRRAK